MHSEVETGVYPHLSVTVGAVSLCKAMLIPSAFEQSHKIETVYGATQGQYYFLPKGDKTMFVISVTAAYWTTR